MSTSRAAKHALTANRPHYLPISLTIPTPNSAAYASILAETIDLTDSEIAVSNPNDKSAKGMSSSIEDGIQIT